jgi:hypothetical protein
MRLSDSVRTFLLDHLSNFSRLSSFLAHTLLLAVGCPLVSVHPKTMFLDVILRSKATKNLIFSAAAEILRSAQNDIRGFPDEHLLMPCDPLS